jgi:hydrogenase nickel incorporation protein HypA/HybF
VHELSVAGAVLETARKHADGRQVTVVSLRVGRMRQVVPSSLLFYWEIVSRDTSCDGARLELTEVDARLRCADCDTVWEPDWALFRCAECGSADVQVEAGEELEVEFIEVEETEAACIGPK